MKIIFARHGESQANLLHVFSNRSLPHGLTQTGRAQAEALAGNLQSRPITRIYSSPVPRAVETATIVAQSLGLPVEQVEALREYDCGVLEGRSDEQAIAEWRRVAEAWVIDQRYDACIEGGETFHDIRQRFVPFVRGLVAEYTAEPDEILCLSHGGIYLLMLPLVVNNLNRGMFSRFGLGYTAYLVTQPQGQGLLCTEWNGQAVKLEDL